MKKMLFRIEAATDLRKRKDQPWSWSMEGWAVDGKRLTMRTSRVGRHEKRWIPTKLIGQVVQLTYHETKTGKLMADLWRPSWAEGEDLVALWCEQERQALHAVSQATTQHMNVRQGPRRM